MKKTNNKKPLWLNKSYLRDLVLILLFLIYFRSNLTWMVKYFLQPSSYEYTFLFILSLIVLYFFTRGKYTLKASETISTPIFFLFSLSVGIDLINIFFLKYQIISASAMILGAYAILGIYLKEEIWRRGVYLIGITALSLPFAEHIQTFLGFPIRLFTAKVVSGIMGLIGLSSLNDAAVIVTENNTTSVDVPCSGIKSIYTGMIVLLILFFLKRAVFSVKLILITFAYFALLIFFNIWRVFSLVYIYDVIDFPAFADAIHVGIGLIGFIFSTFLLWHLIDRFNLKNEQFKKKKKNKEKYSCKKIYLVILLIIAIIADSAHLAFFQSQEPLNQSNEIIFNIPNLELKKIDFDEKEKDFFVNQEVNFSQKYIGKTKSGRPFSLLIISSASWKTHHNPELCLQGIGHKINHSDIIQIGDLRLRQLSLNEKNDTVFYWFTNGKKTTMDYSERIWEGIKNPQEVWTLIEIGFEGSVNIESFDVMELIEDLNSLQNSALTLDLTQEFIVES